MFADRLAVRGLALPLMAMFARQHLPVPSSKATSRKGDGSDVKQQPKRIQRRRDPRYREVADSGTTASSGQPELQNGHRFGAPPSATVHLGRWQCSDSFTESGRRVVGDAYAEAYAHRSDHVGTEHVLLAVVERRDQVVTEILCRAGLHPADVRRRVEDVIGPSQEPRPAHLPYSTHVKQAFTAGMQRASYDGRLIDDVHILYGLFSQPANTAAQIVTDLGVDPKSICRHAATFMPTDGHSKAQRSNAV